MYLNAIAMLHRIYTFAMDSILIELIKIYHHQIKKLNTVQLPTIEILKY